MQTTYRQPGAAISEPTVHIDDGGPDHDTPARTAAGSQRLPGSWPAGKLADVELRWQAGCLEGLKLQGFALWQARSGDGRVNLTLPARAYTVNGERRTFALLRTIDPAANEPHARIRHLVLEAWEHHQERSQDAQPTTASGPNRPARFTPHPQPAQAEQPAQAPADALCPFCHLPSGRAEGIACAACLSAEGIARLRAQGQLNAAAAQAPQAEGYREDHDPITGQRLGVQVLPGDEDDPARAPQLAGQGDRQQWKDETPPAAVLETAAAMVQGITPRCQQHAAIKFPQTCQDCRAEAIAAGWKELPPLSEAPLYAHDQERYTPPATVTAARARRAPRF